MTTPETIALSAFVLVSSLILMLSLLLGARKNRLETRLDDLALSGRGEEPPNQAVVKQLARTTLPKLGTAMMPSDQEERTRLQTRLIHAGMYGRQALVVFLGVKMLLMVSPALLGLAAASLGLVPVRTGVVIGAVLGIIGMIGPSFWLDRMKAARQMAFRRALPDALDVLVICLEGGLSLPGALKRVAGELRTAHPGLATELNIVQREVQLGRTTGEALRHFAERSDLSEIRSLASVITQAERFGASLVKSLRVHADMLREKRLHDAEELAQKAAVKILFPTLLCILPAIFIIVLGPAVIHLMAAFQGMSR
jgi:tight adherence protein C